MSQLPKSHGKPAITCSQSYKAGFSDYALLVSLAAIFGGAFMLTKIAVVEVPPATIVFVRLAIAAAIICGVMMAAGQTFASLSGHWPIIVLGGFFGNALPFALVTWGQERVDAGLTAILMACMPLLTLILAHFATRDERLDSWKLAGCFMGLAGVAYLFGFDKLLKLGDEAIRQYAIIGAACCYAIHAIISKYLLGVPRKAVSAALLSVSAAMLLPFALFFDHPWTLSPSWMGWLSMVLLGIFPTALGTLMLFAIIQRQGAGFLSQINFLVPVFGVVWAILFLGESVPKEGLIALFLILVGVGIARLSPKTQTHGRIKP